MSLIDTTTVHAPSSSSASLKLEKTDHHMAITRSTGVEFTPPVTHDMVRSLFDPTIKKSFFEIIVLAILLSNFILAYVLCIKLGANFTKDFYILQYIFWRLSYNVGIGFILHYQSHYESLTNYAKRNKLFDKKNQSNSKLARLLQFELKSKLNKEEQNNIYSYPDELNVWLIFRQFVDLILMQDFNTYMVYVFLSLPINNLSKLIQWKSIFGLLLILFNIWVKLDAHRVVKDFAWYWGDFFFLQKGSELIFDGVFNISPHPMYSIGYAGYYGLSLISGDYQVLLISIFGHLSQFLFLKYVENPHIERTYGNEGSSDSSILSSSGNCGVDDLITRENYDYSRPLISIGFWLENFDKLRIGDITTVISILSLIAWYFEYQPSAFTLFLSTFMVKLVSWSLISAILWKQHVSKWFTKLYLSNGYTQVYSYQQWQFLYNYSQTISYSLLILQTVNQMRQCYYNRNMENPIKSYMNDIIFGLLLCALQIWCNEEIRSAISDFGWFYGDFFLSNYITHKKLTSQGIYKYLNDPETVLGVSGVWGTVLMTQFCYHNVLLATLWTLTNFVLIKFIERPHLIKLYGNDNANRQSGVQRTLLQMKPIRRVSEIVDNMERLIITNLLKTSGRNTPLDSDEEQDNNKSSSLDEIALSKRKDWNSVLEHALYNVSKNLKTNCELKLLSVKNNTVILPNEIIVHWKIPKELYGINDWIGLHRVIDTQNNHKYKSVSPVGHCQSIFKDSININVSNGNGNQYVEGDIIFNHNQLYFENGIFEFKYHQRTSQKVMAISQPFRIRWPQLRIDSLESLIKSLSELCERIECVERRRNNSNSDNNDIHISFNSNFTIESLRSLLRDSMGITLSKEYIKNVQGNVNTLCSKVWEVKKILDELD
ncbi:phosphatidylethanolamine N-methyltransferase PWA37_000584 [Arxiozyma heterogenica]|uniref:phosphatidylethanolamine N-methyltransferase n=1 Tax=Arxiozyma heterogenica TaxID=278026 RepID=UPI002F04BE8A